MAFRDGPESSDTVTLRCVLCDRDEWGAPSQRRAVAFAAPGKALK